jgi:hypothetical protein
VKFLKEAEKHAAFKESKKPDKLKFDSSVWKDAMTEEYESILNIKERCLEGVPRPQINSVVTSK